MSAKHFMRYVQRFHVFVESFLKCPVKHFNQSILHFYTYHGSCFELSVVHKGEKNVLTESQLLEEPTGN